MRRILPIIFCLLLSGSPAMAQEVKNVLVLYGNTAELPWIKVFDASLRSSVVGGSKRRVEFYSEYFDVARFPEAKHQKAFIGLLNARYADRKIDVIVLGGGTAFDFLMSQRQNFLPHVPFVFSFLPPDKVEAKQLPRGVVGVPVDFGPMPTIEMALRLHPKTKRLVLVTGAGRWDRAWEKRLRDETAALRQRLEVEFLAGLPTAQLLERLSALPKDTVVFTPGYFNDGAGTAVIPREVVEAMAAKSPVPVYVAYETYVGTGAVGGVIPTFTAVGRQTGQIVAALLEGKSPAALQLPRVLKGEPLLDWRQLRRWSIAEKLLPAGTVVQFKVPSIWEQYHERSSRADGPHVKVNCATLPEALVESELFGHEKGAFTGADRQRKGRFELADGGTILLDEVAELQPSTQAKLLRVLQEGEFERVGGSNTIKVSVRVIAATNRKLHDEISAGRFRQDLFYRLNVYPITVPPLRQRREDIPLLVSHYARQFGENMGKSITEVPAQVMHEFTAYNWPGNIRELQNVIERAVIISSDGVLRLPEPLGQAAIAPASEGRPLNESINVSTLDEAEREHILRALEATGWRIQGPKGAAAMLKLHPSTLRFRMKKLGLAKVLDYTSRAQKSKLH
jgi:ABC-type uncharacterized transport system substrate-binding protein